MAASSCCWSPSLLVPSTSLRTRVNESQEVRTVPLCRLTYVRRGAIESVRCRRQIARASVDQEQKTKEEIKEKVEETKGKVEESLEKVKEDADAVTQKYGLEAGLWQIFKSKDGANGKAEGKSRGQQAKDLLAKYGVAYLGTSISLSLVSITVCYLLINSGVDVAALLDKVGIKANAQGEQVGTFALAYAAHKALSPVRFPPTVALTPIVANFLGKKPIENKGGEK